MKITLGYQGKSVGISALLFHFQLLQLLPYPGQGKLREYYQLPKVNPQTNGAKGESCNLHSRLSQNLATALKCLYLDNLANTGTDMEQVMI